MHVGFHSERCLLDCPPQFDADSDRTALKDRLGFIVTLGSWFLLSLVVCWVLPN